MRETTPDAANPRELEVLRAADAFTRYPDDADAYADLQRACEAITDDEWEVLRDGR